MKAYGGGGKTPRVINLGTRCRLLCIHRKQLGIHSV